MQRSLSQLFPLIYLTCLVVLLWQAFRVMGRGFRANSDSRRPPITVHPELLDADGRITEEELLTVRFSGDNEPSDPGGSDDHAS
ncbi:MAG: DUF2973 domain-containing protein [Synechococcus sp. TMED155]|nr:MAG: DUF2973 domain-containing protein [Synechococcus sp. TMED155]